MTESPIRKLCESPHRKLIVVIVTTLFGLLVLIPLVDDYFDNKESHNSLSEDLESARLTEAGLPDVEKQVAEILEKLATFESRAISSQNTSDYRSKVVELVRDTGCQVRRFDVSTPIRRPWMKNDNPLEIKAPQGAKHTKTPFALERRNVVLLVDGSMQSLRDFLGQLHKDEALAYLNRLELKSTSRGSDQVTMEVELWLFALGRLKA